MQLGYTSAPRVQLPIKNRAARSGSRGFAHLAGVWRLTWRADDSISSTR